MTNKAPSDPEVIMLAAVARNAAEEQLYALLRLVQNCASIAETWKNLGIDPGTVESTALVRWLSHEAPRQEHPLQSAVSDIEWQLSRLKSDIDDYDRAQDLQKQMNRIRLRLMGDVDFPGGEGWQKLIDDCKTTADQSRKRR
jgi:TolA-binding protein